MKRSSLFLIFSIFLFSLIFIFTFDIKAQNSPENNDSINTGLLFKDKIETEKWLLLNKIPALAIGYIEDGKIKDYQMYGELEKGHPATLNTIFNVASLTKPVSALVVLKLINLGLWDLDEPLSNYWTDPDIADHPWAQQLTTRYALSHQTGFPNWRWKPGSDKLEFDFEPGTRYQYSGEGFEYLRKAIENKFGKDLNQLASELIFEPYNMNDTKYYWDEFTDEKRFAKGHDNQGNTYKTEKKTTICAADDLLTTIEDYCQFILHILDHGKLNVDIYSEMISNQIDIKPNQYFGLGWSIVENLKETGFILMHTGSDPGTNTLVMILPKTKQGLVIFTNCDHGEMVYFQAIPAILGSAGQEILDMVTQ